MTPRKGRHVCLGICGGKSIPPAVTKQALLAMTLNVN
jgi:hypothetical protein